MVDLVRSSVDLPPVCLNSLVDLARSSVISPFLSRPIALVGSAEPSAKSCFTPSSFVNAVPVSCHSVQCPSVKCPVSVSRLSSYPARHPFPSAVSTLQLFQHHSLSGFIARQLTLYPRSVCPARWPASTDKFSVQLVRLSASVSWFHLFVCPAVDSRQLPFPPSLSGFRLVNWISFLSVGRPSLSTMLLALI